MDINERRLSILISEEQYNKLSMYIPWGMKTAVFRSMIDDLILLLEDEESRKKVLGAIMSKSLNISKVKNE